jgi:hypothetical protein
VWLSLGNTGTEAQYIASLTGPQGPAGLLPNGAAAGNTPYWNGSQWVVNSSNIYNNGGNVGIGTINPSSELNVVGDQAEITLRSTGNQFHHGAIVFEAKGSNAITNKRAMGLFMLDSLGGNEWFAGRPYGSDLGGSSDQFVIQRLATNVHNVSASGVANGANVPTGTQRLITLTSNGNLGVGRSNPTSALEIGGDAKVFGSTTSKFASGESVTLELPQSQPAVIFADSVNNKRADIRMTGTGDIRFSTGSISSGSNGQDVKMFIAENGNVGVGTSAPAGRMHVVNTSGQVLFNDGGEWIVERTLGVPFTARNLDNNNTSNLGHIQLQRGSGAGSSAFITTIGNGANGVSAMGFAIGNNNMIMSLLSTGNVGIGTTTPQRRLHVSDVMRLEPRATAPTSPAKGDIYFDSTLNKLRVFDGTVWQNCW